MNPILQCFPANQAAIVAKAGVYSEPEKNKRKFYTKLRAGDIAFEYGVKQSFKRTNNYKTEEMESKIIAAVTGDACTPYKVAVALGLVHSSIKKVMNRLFEEGKLQRFESSASGKKKTFIYAKNGQGSGVMSVERQADMVLEAIGDGSLTAYKIMIKTGFHGIKTDAIIHHLLKTGRLSRTEAIRYGKNVSLYKQVR